MEKIIFVGLLSLSLCLSSPADLAKPNPTLPTGTTVDLKTNSTSEASVPTIPVTKDNHTETPAQTTANTVTAKPDGHTVPINETTNKANNTPTENSKASNVTEKVTTVVPTTPASTTAKATTVHPTVTPKPDDDDKKVIVQARGFDGGSFIGGIILTLGMLAIGFIGFKYYKAQTERNYHTL